MGETPYEPFFHGPPRRGGARRRPLERTFRCHAAPSVAPMSRYERFVALHAEVSARPRVRGQAFWAGGFAIALAVTGLVLVGTVVLRGIGNVPMPVFVRADLSLGSAAMGYGISTFLAVMQATALLHVLALLSDRPLRSFGWIGTLGVGLVTVLPLTVGASAGAALGTSVVNLMAGTLVVGTLAGLLKACLVTR